MALFLAGIVAAMAYTQHLRSEGPTASSIYFKAIEGPGGPRYRICFQTPRDDSFEVAIVGADGRAVAILAQDLPIEGDPSAGKGSANCFDWDGLDEAGVAVPAGTYRLRLTLERAERRAVSGEKLRITEPAQPAAEPAEPAG
ncbi:MAG: hypothetical protein FJW90_10010 [Actinobacteria bacterium]|nr:hypothetical protein [Actinomycetota bacterium]